MLDELRAAAGRLNSEIAVIASAVRDPRTPWLARALAVIVIAYALSPIDLIPDFIPVLGMLDDLILVPAGLWLLVQLIPDPILAEHRLRVTAGTRLKPSRAAAVVIIALWIAGIAATVWWLVG